MFGNCAKGDDSRLSQGRVPLTMTTEQGAARLHTHSVFSEHP